MGPGSSLERMVPTQEFLFFFTDMEENLIRQDIPYVETIMEQT